MRPILVGFPFLINQTFPRIISLSKSKILTFIAILCSFGWTRLFSSLQQWRLPWLEQKYELHISLFHRAALLNASDHLWSFSRKQQIFFPFLWMNELCGSLPSAADQSSPLQTHALQWDSDGEFGHSAQLWLPPCQVITGENYRIIASYERGTEMRFGTCIALAY